VTKTTNQEEIPAEATGNAVKYSTFSIMHCGRAFDTLNACKYALCPVCVKKKLTESDNDGGKNKRRRRAGDDAATNDGMCTVHQIVGLMETTQKSYLPRCRNDLEENHNIPEICFVCGDTL
jgi:hypothetical protein